MKKNNHKLPQKQPSIQVEFSGKTLTNVSGILPFHKLMEQMGISALLKKSIDLGDAANTIYSTPKIILTTILGIIAGNNRVSKIESFSRDPLVKRLMDIPDKLDADTIGTRFKRFTMKTTSAFMTVIGTLSKRVHKRLKTAVEIWDIDSTVRTVYGHQEGATKGYNPEHKGKRSYHPLLCFANSTKECVRGWLRPGNSYTSNNVVGFLHECMSQLPASVKTLFIRGDCGFFDGKLLAAAETYTKGDRSVTYTIKVKMSGLSGLLSVQDWEKIPEKSGWEETVFYHQCDGWDTYRRFVSVRRFKGYKPDSLFPIAEYDYFCYVTNSPSSPYDVHDFYGDRGESENWIEAVKNQLFGGCFLTSSFWANEALWQCSLLAYNLSVWLRKLTDKASWREEPGTFRQWFVQLAGKIIQSGRRVIVKMYSAYHYKDRWMGIYERVCTLIFE